MSARTPRRSSIAQNVWQIHALLVLGRTPSSGTLTTNHENTMHTENDTSKPEDSPEHKAGGDCPSASCCGSFGRVFIDDAGSYQPGDLPPEGYLQWHEWAEVQRKAGIKQVECGMCSKWQTPQELSGEKMTMKARTSKGDEVTLEWAVCTKCAAKHHSLHNATAQTRRAGD